MKLTRRDLFASLAASGATLAYRPARAAKSYDPPGALVDAAKKEGGFTLFSATFPEVQQEVIALFNKRFPFVKVRFVRASGGQLITRVRTEAAAGKLEADVIEHSDRGQVLELESLFADYAPPNASDYMKQALVSPKLWPTVTISWCIAWNPELVKNPPQSWMDLCKPEYGDGRIGQVIGPSGGTTWTRIMFERQVLGEDYWAKQAATKPKLFPSGGPLSDSVTRGEVQIAPLTHNAAFPKKRDGAPIEAIYPPEGIPVIPYGSGIPKSARNPNAARLWLDWVLSDDGQTQSIRDQGNLTSLASPPVKPDMFDPSRHKLWLPEFAAFNSLRDKWLAEWNKTYGYRQ
ncbi:MAG: ABC transporter substrate-binding protein [Acetobacteraceae bacterium]